MDFPFEILLICKESYPTGSNYICEPPVTNTDIDYVCLTDKRGHRTLNERGFIQTDYGDEYSGLTMFYSLRRKNINLIVTYQKDFYDKFVQATREAKRLNLIDKEERIQLFQEILYGVETEIPF